MRLALAVAQNHFSDSLSDSCTVCGAHKYLRMVHFDCRCKDRKAVAEQLKAIFSAPSVEAELMRLEEFENGAFGKKFPMFAQSWRRNWEQAIPFLSYPAELRKMIYTTNAIEILNMQLREVLKNRGYFPSDEAASKLIYLALRNITRKWQKPAPSWRAAATQFAIQFGSHFFHSENC